MSYTLKIRGLAEVQRGLNVNLSSVIRTASRAAAEQIKSELAPYPPATIANSPSAGRWYQRGYGPFWRVKSGEVHSRKSSEQLGQKWAVRGHGATGAVLGTIVKYAPFVQTVLRQVAWAKRIGWRIDLEAIKRAIPAIKEIYVKAIMVQLKRGNY